MNREEIIRMAMEAGLDAEADTLCHYGGFVKAFEYFAALVAAAEREQCAVVCDERALLSFDNSAEQCEAQDCAEEIRARGNGGEK